MRAWVGMEDAGDRRIELMDRYAELFETEDGRTAAGELVIARHGQRAAEGVGEDLRPHARRGQRGTGGHEARDWRDRDEILQHLEEAIAHGLEAGAEDLFARGGQPQAGDRRERVGRVV